MSVIKFEVPGDPVGKQRHRRATNKFTGKLHTYTPKKTRMYEALVSRQAQRVYDKEPISQNVSVKLDIYFKVPKSYSKKRTESCLLQLERPGKKPDIDNVVKSVLDGMNNIVYLDDKQVVGLVVNKYYAKDPKVIVNVTNPPEKISIKGLCDLYLLRDENHNLWVQVPKESEDIFLANWDRNSNTKEYLTKIFEDEKC